MAKIRGDSLYANEEDGELFTKGREFPRSKEIEKFCKEVLDNTFDTWVLVGRDVDERSFKEIEGGKLMSGMVLCNLGKTKDKKLNNASTIKKIEGKSRLAMMIIDLVEGICDDEREAEAFLEALTETIKRIHAKDDGKDVEAVKKEMDKIDVLKGLLHTAIDSFKTYEGKEKYVKSCLGSVTMAHLLESGDEDLKNKARESMKASILNGEIDNFARKSVDRIEEFVDIVLAGIDAGNSPAEMIEILTAFRESL
jgi:hypothetical protein